MGRSRPTCMANVAFAPSLFTDLLDDTEMLLLLLTGIFDCVALILCSSEHAQ